jgi:hypothetical protein
MGWLVWIVGALAALGLGLFLWQVSDRRADTRIRAALIAQATADSGGRFDPAMLADLPEAARRYFSYVMSPGVPICGAAEIWMQGQMGLGDKADPGYRPMRAHQVLAPPYGLVWQVAASALGGSDGAYEGHSWTRFWMFRLLPVVRVGDTRDHLRSSLGRVVAEAAFWVPSALLPGPQVRWEPVSTDTARAIVAHDGMQQAVDITVNADGRPTKVVIDRWSNANPEGVFRLQPFGGTLDDFREVSGYRLPFDVDGGNHFGTPEYFPFFRARVDRIELHCG